MTFDFKTVLQILVFIVVITMLILLNKTLRESHNSSKRKKIFWISLLIWTLFYTTYFAFDRMLYLYRGSFANFSTSTLPYIFQISIIPFFKYILSGLLVLGVLFKKIVKPYLIGASIGIVIFLLGGLIPGINYIEQFTLYIYSLKFDPLKIGIFGFILVILLPLIILVAIGSLVGLILGKLDIKKRPYNE